METIIYTDNKRHSTDYTSDKTLFAERIDVNHILNTEVYQSHISKVMFWVVRNNIPNQETFATQVCKNLANRGFNIINFQYCITQIQYGPLPQIVQDSKTSSQRVSRKSSVLQRQMFKTVQFPSQFKKQNLLLTPPSLHNKTSSNFENVSSKSSFYEQSNKQQNKNQARLACLYKQQHSISTLNQFITLLNNKQINWKNSKNYNQNVLQRKKVIVSYTFKQSDFSIGVSVINQGAKKYLQTVIQLDVSQTLNKNFNNRKTYFQSDRIIQSSTFKSSVRIANDTKQTYHKILLFLFTADCENQKDKISKALNLKQKYVSSLSQWKIKDEDINMTQKLSKQYVLIKQEIQNEKLNFRNKVKIFEAIIGESINVQKLLNEEKELQTNSNMMATNTIINDVNTRFSRKSSMKQIPVVVNQPGGNTEFKRLKQSFQMIRNIDNIINEQAKKIQNYKKIHKQTLKEKNEELYRHAKALNTIKKQIKSLRDQIKQKQIQLQIKCKTGYVQKIQYQKNFDPTQSAQKQLQKNVGLFQKIIAQRKSHVVDKQEQIQDNPYSKEQQKNKKEFAIRKQHKSLHKGGQFLNKTSSQMNTWVKKLSKYDQNQLKLKRQEQFENQTLLMNLNKNNSKSLKQNQTSNQFQKNHQNILMECYKYYENNKKMIQEGISSLKHGNKNPFKINQNYMNTINFSDVSMNPSKNYSMNLTQLKKSKLTQNRTFDQSLLLMSQINFDNFPILQTLINPNRFSYMNDSQFDECSLASQTNHIELQETINKQNKQGNLEKRPTIYNLVMIQNNKKNQLLK